MSPADQQWDEEVRRTVEAHEFEYEPAAWAGLEQLLEAVPPLPPAGGAAKGFSFWGWVLAAGLAGGLLWYALRPAAPALVFETREGTPALVPMENEEMIAPSIPLSPPHAAPKRPPSPPHAADPALVEPEPDLTPARPSWPVLLPLPSLPLPPQLRHQRADTLKVLPLAPSPAPSRKRDRKTLFPDVIENY
jgi:hypothetical protein